MSKTVSPQDFAFVFRLPTRWSDLDMLGHVNNSRFFSFDESARLEYFGELMRDDPTFWKQRGFILARIECDFLAQLHHPAQVDVGFRIARIGRSSMDTLAGMFVDGKPVATSRGVLVWYDYEQQKPQPVPDDVRALIRERERIAPEE
ncbi:MAG: acyl-CoA thioesterase [Sinimarinibacterium flocculans]|uniref:acyl-CoA thioesterase n=1 Tax=Sinimarinibacterium flocculans TaxID=985250 RepID=UPI002493B0E4|nr:thioesterase family protein [Sinimarinibacterium flocculans]